MLSTKVTIIACLVAAWCWTSDGQLYNVACPGTKSKLQCPEGQVIEVLSIKNGVKSNADCNAQSQPAKITGKDCIRKSMTEWTKLICDDRESCQLSKPHSWMFECDFSEDAFVQISYNCKKKPADERVAVACEGQTADIQCEKGVINIVKASFGRLDEKTCTDEPSEKTYCTSYSAGERAKIWCNGKQSCYLAAISELLGEPTFCDSLPLYLAVRYVCQ